MRNGVTIGVVLVAILTIFAISRQTKGNRPCRKITQACKSAGYKRGHTPAERKEFYEACMKPLMEKGTLGDIQVSNDDALACKTKMEKRSRHGGKGKDQPSETSDSEADASDEA